MNRYLILSLTIIMFFFKNLAMANYEKVFYDFKIESITGEIINFDDYKDKVVLLVNTASYCGFTKQYAELQQLWSDYKSKGLIVPASKESTRQVRVQKFGIVPVHFQHHGTFPP